MSIKINFANISELMLIPRVGEVVAKEILQYRCIFGNLSIDDILEGKIKSLRLNRSFLQMVDFAENPILRINDDEDDYRLMTVDETQDLPSNIQSYTSKVCTLTVCTTSLTTIPSVSTSTSTVVTQSYATPLFMTSTPTMQSGDRMELIDEVRGVSVDTQVDPLTPESSAAEKEITNIQRPIVRIEGGLRDSPNVPHTDISAPSILHGGDMGLSGSTRRYPAAEFLLPRQDLSSGMKLDDDMEEVLEERKEDPSGAQAHRGNVLSSSMDQRAEVHPQHEAKLFVTNLPSSIDKCSLSFLFKGFDVIKSIQIRSFEDSTAAEIIFNTEEDARRAKDISKHKIIEGKAVQVLLVASEEPKEVKSTGARPKVKSVNTQPEQVPSREEKLPQRHTVKMTPPTPKVSRVQFSDPCSLQLPTPCQNKTGPDQYQSMSSQSPLPHQIQSPFIQPYTEQNIPITQAHMYRTNILPVTEGVNNPFNYGSIQSMYPCGNFIPPYSPHFIPVTSVTSGQTTPDQPFSSNRNFQSSPIQEMPRDLKFNGRSRWRSFIEKFNRYANGKKWDSDTRLYNLLWCLEGKASDFYLSTTDCEPNITYTELIAKFEKKYDTNELLEISRLHFDQCHQFPDEKLNDWADRVLLLAQKAKRDLSEAIAKFCHGCKFKEAGQLTSYLNPQTMEEAINKIKWHHHTVQATYGNRKSERSTRKTSEANSRHINVVSKEIDAVSVSDDRFLLLEKQVKMMMNKFKKMEQPTNSGKKPDRTKVRCYNCNKVGHYKRECQLDVKETTSSQTSVKESRPRQPEEDSHRSENSERSDQQA